MRLNEAIEQLKYYQSKPYIPTVKKVCDIALDTIEALEQENEQLRAQTGQMREADIVNNKVKAIIDAAPERCPITGLKKCESYTIGDNVVYLPEPAYDAYTLPEYDPDSKAFYRIHYDMDDDFRQETEWLCDLDDLRGRKDFKQIKAFYGIVEGDGQDE